MVGIARQLIQTGFQVQPDLTGLAFFRDEQRGHQGLAGFRTRIRLRAKTDFAGDDLLSQLALGEIVVGGNRTVLCPIIQAMRVFTKDILNFLNARMARLAVHDLLNFYLQLVAARIDSVGYHFSLSRRQKKLAQEVDSLKQMRQ